MIEEIKKDMHSGSKELALKAISHLINLVRGRGKREVLKYLKALREARKGFVVLENIADIVEKKVRDFDVAALVDFLGKMKMSIIDAQNRINENFFKAVRNSKRFLTISKSSTIISSFSYICNKRKIVVFVMESQPLGEGVTTTTLLNKSGCIANTIPDATSSYYIQLVDNVVVGADAVTLKGFYNKIGTLQLALLANHFNIPFYVLTDTLKVSRKKEIEVEFIDIGEEGGKKLRIPLLELIPHRFVSKYITEKGELEFQKLVQV